MVAVWGRSIALPIWARSSGKIRAAGLLVTCGRLDALVGGAAEQAVERLVSLINGVLQL